MSLLRSLFGASKRQVWEELAGKVDGEFVAGGFFGKDIVQAAVGDWMITLDTYEEGGGESSQTYTRLRAPYVNPNGFRFRIYRASIFSGLGKLLGMEDIRTGDPAFDRDFIVKANSAQRVRALIADDEIRTLLMAQPRLHLEVKDDEGWFRAAFPEGVDELYFRAAGVMKDLAHLENLFVLFAEVLHHLCHESPAYEDDVELHIRRLHGPGGRIETDRVMLWEGDSARRDAAEALGNLADPKAVPALVRVLKDDDEQVRAHAIDALMRIEHAKAVRPLIPLLGDAQKAAGRRIRDRAGDALRNLGAGDVVDVVEAAFQGDYDPVTAYDGPFRKQIVAALEEALMSFSGIHGARALAALRSVESLPALRDALRRTGKRNPAGEAMVAAIEALEARAALPRPAAAGDRASQTLPSPAGEPGPDTTSLPRSARDPETGPSSRG